MSKGTGRSQYWKFRFLTTFSVPFSLTINLLLIYHVHRDSSIYFYYFVYFSSIYMGFLCIFHIPKLHFLFSRNHTLIFSLCWTIIYIVYKPFFEHLYFVFKPCKPVIRGYINSGFFIVFLPEKCVKIFYMYVWQQFPSRKLLWKNRGV